MKVKQRYRLWSKNPHCFWCGRRTQYFDRQPKGGMPPDAATIDHIRSRLSPARKLFSGNHSHGIRVLACSQCNHERGQMEQAFMAAVKPRALHERCGNGKAAPTLLNAQAALCASLLRFMRHGGKIEGKHAQAVLDRADDVRKMYAAKNAARRNQLNAKRKREADASLPPLREIAKALGVSLGEVRRRKAAGMLSLSEVPT